MSKITDLCRENSKLKTQLYDEQGRNKKLLARLNRDYENSSIPSSQSRNSSKIPNNCECTKRTRGTARSTHHCIKKTGANSGRLYSGTERDCKRSRFQEDK